jgi:hypothetical protein
MDFFPPNALDEQPGRDAFRERWYAAHFVAMQERPLYPPAADQRDVYRLLFLPTFDSPAVVRLTDADGVWKLLCKRTDGKGAYWTGRLVAETRRGLLHEEARQLVLALERAAFWEMPSLENSLGFDGSQAVQEGVHAGKYHVVDRWSPRGTRYAKLVLFILQVAGAFSDLERYLR